MSWYGFKIINSCVLYYNPLSILATRQTLHQYYSTISTEVLQICFQWSRLVSLKMTPVEFESNKIWNKCQNQIRGWALLYSIANNDESSVISGHTAQSYFTVVFVPSLVTFICQIILKKLWSYIVPWNANELLLQLPQENIILHWVTDHFVLCVDGFYLITKEYIWKLFILCNKC